MKIRTSNRTELASDFNKTTFGFEEDETQIRRRTDSKKLGLQFGDFEENQRNVQCFRLGKRRRSGFGFEEDEIRRRRDFNLKETRFEKKEWLEISILKTKVKCFRVGKALNKDRFSRRDTLCTTCSNFCHIGKGDAVAGVCRLIEF